MVLKRLLIGLISALAIVVVTFMLMNNDSQEDNLNSIKMDLYFFNETSTSIVAEERTLSYDNEDSLEETVLNALIKGPTDSKNKPIFDSEVELLSIDNQQKNVVVNFSNDYISEDTTANFLAAYAVVKSLCQLNSVESVKVIVDGNEIVANDGAVMGFLSDKDIDLVTDSTTQDSKTLALYFPLKETNKLKKELRTIKITDTLPVEQYIVNELIRGTKAANLKSIIASDTELISAQTTDTTCFVNFKSGFVEKNSGNEEVENLIIYSIVNSLCELENVNFVQFLVDGKKVDKFGSINILDFFIANTEFNQ